MFVKESCVKEVGTKRLRNKDCKRKIVKEKLQMKDREGKIGKARLWKTDWESKIERQIESERLKYKDHFGQEKETGLDRYRDGRMDQ